MIPSWRLLSQVFTVETIMTGRDQFLTWDGNAPLATLWEEATQIQVDTIPIEHQGQIVSVLRRGQDTPVPLTPEWLVSRDTAIPDVVQLFAEKRTPCLFVFFRQEVIGIVTPADLNKLPARTYFYNLLAELEMTIAEIVRRQYGTKQDNILNLLGKQDELDEIKQKMAESDLSIDIVHWLDLSDLVNLACKNDILRKSLGFPSAKQVGKKMNGLVDMRHDIMHPVRLILDDYTGIERLNERIQRTLTILNRLTTSRNGTTVEVVEK